MKFPPSRGATFGEAEAEAEADAEAETELVLLIPPIVEGLFPLAVAGGVLPPLYTIEDVTVKEDSMLVDAKVYESAEGRLPAEMVLYVVAVLGKEVVKAVDW